MQKVALGLELQAATAVFCVYGDDRDGAVIPVVHVRKAALSDPPPTKLVVTLAADA